MNAPKYPQSFFPRLAWATMLILVGAFFLVYWLPVPESRRWLLDLLLVLLGALLFGTCAYVVPRYWPADWISYVSIAVDSGVIAIFDYVLQPIDLSPFYIVVIVVGGMIASRRAALFTAALAGILQAIVTLADGGADGITWIAQVCIHTTVYFLTAFLVSDLVAGLAGNWRSVLAETEQQRAEIALRRDELEGLYEIAQVFGDMENVRATFYQVTEKIAHLLDADICFILSVDESMGTVRGLPPGYGVGDAELSSFVYTVTRDLARLWDVWRHKTLILNDLTRLPPAMAQIAAGVKIKGLLGARMMHRGRPIGLIFAGNKRQGKSFGSEDARLLSILAGQAAIAVENARLYAVTQENLQNVTRLYAISARLTAREDLEGIPDYIVHAVSEALNAPIGSMALVNELTGELEYAATMGVPPEARTYGFRETGTAMTVLRSGQPRFVEDLRLVGDVNPVTRVWGFLAHACLPIQHGDKKLGVLYVNYSEPHTFTPVEKQVLAIFANQAAIALENARLAKAEQRKTLELQTVATLSRSLAETMDLDQMFRAIEYEVHAALPAADGGVLLVYEPVADLLTPRSSFGFDRAVLAKLALRPGESIPGRVFLTGQAMLVSGKLTVQDMRTALRPENREVLSAAIDDPDYPDAVICAPIACGGEKLGVIILESRKTLQAFNIDDLRLLEAIADRAALAIRNAHLYARGLRRATQLATMAEVTRRVAAILDLNELLPTIARLIQTQFGYRYVHLFLNHSSRPETIFRAGAGPAAEAMEKTGVTVKYGLGIVGSVAASGELWLANDVRLEPRFVEHPLLPDTRAELSIPLRAGAHPIGVLDVQSEFTNTFESSDVAVLETLAGQIAIAIENAQLYGQVKEQSRRDSLTQVYNHGYFLERLAEELDRVRQTGCPLSLIMVDIDWFKEYNDRYGHVIGDLVLGATAQAISVHVHASDLVGRWGGEEFGIALSGADEKAAYEIAQRIRQTLADTRLFTKEGIPILPPTMSQGLATFPIHAGDTATLIDLADSALYRAKSRGRDQICTSGEGQEVEPGG